MPRWYALYHRTGRFVSPEKTFDNVSALVRNRDLSRVVSRISFEKRAKKTGEFYFAVAIESDERGILPESIQDWDQLPDVLGHIIRDDSQRIKAYDRNDLQWMTNTEVREYARRLTFNRAGDLSPDDPFADPHESAEELDDEGLLARSQGYDRLLRWVSAMGSGSLPQFRAACLALGLNAPADGSARILRRFRVLGHLETSADGQRWSVAPPALIQSGPGPHRYVLAGARDQRLLENLSHLGELTATPFGDGSAPGRVELNADVDDRVDELATMGITVAGRAGERIAGILPDIHGWANTLNQVGGVQPERYVLRQFRDGSFHPVALARESGFYAFHDPQGDGAVSDEPRFSLYFDQPRSRWLRGDWYGLRYLASVNERQGQRLPVRFDAAAGRLAVPQDQRWPELYERTLVLASGRLPVVNGPWLIYDGISRAHLELLVPRLHLEVVETDEELADA